MPEEVLSILWFRQDLRLGDNPALIAAVRCGNILPIYILDDVNPKQFKMGAANRWWLHHSLDQLNKTLGGKLNLYKGDAKDILADLCQRYSIKGIYWNRCYEPWAISRDTEIKQEFLETGIRCESFSGALINEPWEVLKKDKSPYLIFTPYYQQSIIKNNMELPFSKPDDIVAKNDRQSLALSDYELLPKVQWDSHFYKMWQPGEQGAFCKLKAFIADSVADYKEGRDFPARESVSKLSPHIHFGEISPRQILSHLVAVDDDVNCEHFKRELAWREFSYSLLFHFPYMPVKNLKSKFDMFPWGNNTKLLKKWQQGKTGYPIVDAGMRELWQTGFMHNRVRMIVASFLVKNLLIDWRLGAAWFWDCLLDADLASNSASWQWVAGSGTDAAPYFRIFNPVTQGEKFDPHGEYTKRYVPELAALPKKYLFKPWEAPADVLKLAGVVLNVDYPLPIVDVKESRQKALDAFQYIKDVSLN